ncbi:MAG: OsmC family peroxiredoxin [Candidatus Omnitrophota bacterium]|jgi:putative redox protein|nr:MAG: OsmC family peroxiredoxin [Candidatus Omnitrophota bacterium]
MAVEIDIIYQGDLHCEAKHTPSGNTIITDAPVDNGGKGDAFSPTDLVATAQGTCLVTIMGLVARQNEMDIEGTTVHIVKEMAADPIRRIGKLTATITLPPGKSYSADERAILESAAKVCPVKQSLHPDVDVSIEFVYQE